MVTAAEGLGSLVPSLAATAHDERDIGPRGMGCSASADGTCALDWRCRQAAQQPRRYGDDHTSGIPTVQAERTGKGVTKLEGEPADEGLPPVLHVRRCSGGEHLSRTVRVALTRQALGPQEGSTCLSE
ncbi:hypothetical protein RKE32_37105 [Streptomyces sp. Li-HN-5-13]|nr:hypothetical protein RKE32_37105 [Streptomyces sp. Li-HN-5-13]